SRLQAEGLVGTGDVDRLRHEAEAIVEEEARAIIEAPWPEAVQAGADVFANEPPRAHIEVLDPERRPGVRPRSELAALATRPPASPGGRTFLEGVAAGLADALARDPRVFVYGEDVGGRYGNAFLLLRPLLQRFGDRIVNSPLAEGGVLGVCVGAALAGQRP